MAEVHQNLLPSNRFRGNDCETGAFLNLAPLDPGASYLAKILA
jgi:hypothetical protein